MYPVVLARCVGALGRLARARRFVTCDEERGYG